MRRDEEFDLPLGLVRRGPQEIDMIGVRKVRGEEADSGQRELARFQPGKNHGESPAGSRSLDPVECGVLGHTKMPNAETREPFFVLHADT